MTDMRRYVLYGAREIAAFARLSQEIVAGWADQWFIDGDQGVRVVRVVDGSRQDMLPGGQKDEAWGYRHEDFRVVGVLGNDILRTLCDAALGAETSAPYVAGSRGHEVEQALAAEIVQALAQAFVPAGRLMREGDDSPPVQSQCSQGSGWLKIELALGQQTLGLWLNQRAALALNPLQVSGRQPAPLVARSAALATGDLRFVAVAGEADISLAELFELKPGQVVRLDTRFGEPLRLFSVPSGQALTKAWLGVQAGRKAVQINAD